MIKTKRLTSTHSTRDASHLCFEKFRELEVWKRVCHFLQLANHRPHFETLRHYIYASANQKTLFWQSKTQSLIEFQPMPSRTFFQNKTENRKFWLRPVIGDCRFRRNYTSYQFNFFLRMSTDNLNTFYRVSHGD